jgi:hypothetical protein
MFEDDLRGSPILKVASLRRSYAQQRRNGLNAKLASIPGDKISEPAPFLVRLGLWRGTNKEPSLRTSICALGLNPSRVGKLSSGSPSRCTLDFGERQGREMSCV